jgi:hypothetical protein
MEPLFDTGKEVSLEVNTEKTLYVDVLSIECRANRNIQIDNRSFENVAQFKYLEKTITNENLIDKEIKEEIKSG